MPLDARQLRDLVVRPTLAELGLPGGEVAERLVMGTAAQESGLRYLKQVGGGPALGLWQMEPATFADLWKRMPVRVRLEVQELGQDERDLVGNLPFACAMCRVHYYLRPFKMPATADTGLLAAIWKKHYNSYLGAGKVEEFMQNYERLIAPIY